jgi:peptidyl-prolyl cis-trans isomerase SurA
MDHYGFEFDQQAYSDFVRYGKEAFNEGQWIEPPDMEEERVLFTIGDRQMTFKDFSDYLGEQQFAYSFINYPPVVGKHFQDFFLLVHLQYQDEGLESRYPEFRNTMNSYADALLLGNMEQKIWDIASRDADGLNEQFLNNPGKYTTPGFYGLIIRFKSMKSRQQLEFTINSSDLEPEALSSNLEQHHADQLTVERVIVRNGENEIVDHFVWNSSPFKREYSLVLVKGERLNLPAKSLEDALEDVIFDLQKKVEEEMVNAWKKTYSIRYSRRLLKRYHSSME